jgi:hypothetical protein
MKGVSRINTRRLEPPPSQFQGFGRVDITAALPLAGDPSDWRMQVRHKASNATGAPRLAVSRTHTLLHIAAHGRKLQAMWRHMILLALGVTCLPPPMHRSSIVRCSTTRACSTTTMWTTALRTRRSL